MLQNVDILVYFLSLREDFFEEFFVAQKHNKYKRKVINKKMFKIFNKKVNYLEVYSPVTGQLISLESVPDQVFASKMMGKGVAFDLSEDTVCAPIDGKVTLLTETKHAFGIVGENGVEVLVHIGLDTVALNGYGFEKLKDVGDKVTKGTPIIIVDRKNLQEKNINLRTPMVITNSSEYHINILKNNHVISGQNIVLTCEKK